MTSITYQNCGTNWAVLITGSSHEEVEHKFYSFWNWNATGGELDWLDDKRARFWTTRKRMLKYFENITLMDLIDNRGAEFKGKQYGALPEAKRIAREKLLAMQEEKFITRGAYYDAFVCSSATAEKPDVDLKDYFISRAFSV